MAVLRRLLLTLSLIVVPAGSPLAQQTFPLVCRGGPDMEIELRGVRDGTLLFLMFSRASAPAATRAPAPGQCSWMDRVVGGDEPTVLYHIAYMSYPSVLLRANGRVQALNYQPQGDTDSLYRVRSLVDSAMNGRTFTVHVRRLDVATRSVFAVERFER